MNDGEKLAEKLYRVADMLACEARLSRSYGTQHALSLSDMDFLKCVERKAEAKASDLSAYLGVTNGATTQFAKKLEQKGYIEPYRQEGNKKEVFYRLTDCGRAACRGFDEHYQGLRSQAQAYIDGLDGESIRLMAGLLDTVARSLDVGEHCSLMQGEDRSEYPLAAGGKKCEKCRKTY